MSTIKNKNMTNRIESLKTIRKYYKQPIAIKFENLQSEQLEKKYIYVYIYKLQLTQEEIENLGKSITI